MLVMWSGGCDSTLMLHDLAIQNIDKCRITAVSFSTNQIEKGGVESKATRAKLLELMRKKGLVIEHHELAWHASCDGWIIAKSEGLPQAILWQSIGQLMLETDEDLYLGYIRGDDIWHWKSEFWHRFDYSQRIMRKTGSLVLPLEYWRKHEVLERLETIGLLKHCRWCEHADPKPCGRCASCMTHRAGMLLKGETEDRSGGDEFDLKVIKKPNGTKPLAKRRVRK